MTAPSPPLHLPFSRGPLALAAALGLAACGSPEPRAAAQAGPIGAGAPADAKAEPPAPSAAPDDPAKPTAPAASASRPRRGPLAATDEGDLGRLPEGVGVPVGSRAPAVSVSDSDGKPVQLASLYPKGPTLLIFYRGGWCPFCNAQIHDLTQAYPELKDRGVTPVAISVDRAEEANRTRATYTIPFPVLSDPDLVAHRAFSVLQPLEPAYVAKIKALGMDVEASSGRSHHTVAIPSVFLVDREGVVRWAHADPNYKVRPSPQQLLSVIDRVFGAEGAPPAGAAPAPG